MENQDNQQQEKSATPTAPITLNSGNANDKLNVS